MDKREVALHVAGKQPQFEAPGALCLCLFGEDLPAEGEE
jgi:hypothetical protein